MPSRAYHNPMLDKSNSSAPSAGKLDGCKKRIKKECFLVSYALREGPHTCTLCTLTHHCLWSHLQSKIDKDKQLPRSKSELLPKRNILETFENHLQCMYIYISCVIVYVCQDDTLLLPASIGVLGERSRMVRKNWMGKKHWAEAVKRRCKERQCA